MKSTDWLPWDHIAIANLKHFLSGMFHRISKAYLREYLDEFCYRFNYFLNEEINFYEHE